ncbi:hypothetical protein [Rhodoferax lacus]|uniref:hypothetical protein n=1 Tax=Rhodoferax lacus TaxID=2184758 RepID=UPI0018F4D320|nr:hypothetical protein [Rhodoferax lacus]
MANGLNVVLIIGSAPDAVRARHWDLSGFSACVVINNAWQIREDWDFLIYADDFPVERRPTAAIRSHQKLVTSNEFVPEQNRFGGFVYAGGTMSYTTGYWALGALKPDVIAYLGCDMVYPATQATDSHFYGQGQADPLRPDITLQSLQAKSVRLMAIARAQQCAVVNLSELDDSKLLFPRSSLSQLAVPSHLPEFLAEHAAYLSTEAISQASKAEAALGYMVPSGRYWEVIDEFDKDKLSAIDALWLQALEPTCV